MQRLDFAWLESLTDLSVPTFWGDALPVLLASLPLLPGVALGPPSHPAPLAPSAGEMVAELVKQYTAKNKGRPDRLIGFRDGCFEEQCEQVLNLEVNLVRVALRKLDPSHKPEITYVLCAKTHHLSVFPEQPQDGDWTGNVPAGTTIDTVITSPIQLDWSLQSQASLLGTSRSAHYTVLCDESS